MIFIRQIEAEETYCVRQPVLRPGKPIEDCLFEGDNIGTTAHFGLYENENLLGVVSVFKNAHPDFNTNEQFQMRGMAVLEKYQRMGFGEQLVKKAEYYVKEKKGKLLWFNARESANGFYQKMEYKTIGNPFEINEIGLHFIMYKWL